MSTRLHLNGPTPNVSVGPTAARTTAQPARPFQQLIRAGSNAIVATAEQAAVRLPGGPILAAALRPGHDVGDPNAPEGARSALGMTSGALVTRNGFPEATSSAPGAEPLGATAPGSGQGDINGVLSRNSDDNMRYLELQERISHESRTYSALSNVLKARHETVKNAISNIR